MFRIGLCNNDISVIQSVKEIVAKYLAPQNIIFKIYEFSNIKDLYFFILNEMFDLDLLFMDSDPDVDSMGMAKEIKNICCRTSFVFLTNFVDFRSRGLQKELENSLPFILEKQVQRKKQIRKKRLIVPIKNHKIILIPNNIQYLERVRRITHVVSTTETVSTTSSLPELHPQLEPAFFIRCHNSYIVNLNYVKEYNRYGFILKNGNMIPISRRYLKEVNRAFTR